MSSDGEPGQPAAPHAATVAYGTPWRGAALMPFVISRVCAPLLLVALLTAADPPLTPPDLLFLFGVFVAAPAVLAAAIRRAHRAEWRIEGHALVVARRGETVEIPINAIAAVAAWRLPCPSFGLSLRTRAGRRYEIEDAGARLLDALDARGAAGDGMARDSTGAVFARATRARSPRRWYHVVGKFVLFALLPTAPLFNVHQFIAYGGTFGEYYLLGLRAYLTTFAAYWSSVAILLVSFASWWRWLVEVASLAAAALAPRHATAVRVGAEKAATFLYYSGVPVVVALRFWPW